MRKTVTCTEASLKNTEYLGDDLQDRAGKFVFSATDSQTIPGKPKEYYAVTVKITGELLLNWGLTYRSQDDLIKILFYYAMEHVSQKIEKNIPGDETPKIDEIILTTNNYTDRRCPVAISEIHKVMGFSFDVNVREQEDEHANQSLKRCLEDFAGYIRSEKRMTFWQHGNTNKRKWISRPEEYAKNLLHTFLTGRFGGSIYTFEEITSGAGRLDLFIVSPSDENVVVELKMCGHGYSLPYAQEGKRQLSHYMENQGTRNGYLLIFDSRVSDFAKGLQETESINGLSIFNIVIDLRPHVKQQEAPKSLESV